MRTSTTRLFLLLLIAAACSQKEDGPARDRQKQEPAGKAPPPADAAAPAPAAQEHTFEERGLKVKTRFTPPAGWKVTYQSESSITFQGSWTSMFGVSLTCHGSCGDAAQLRKDIVRHAQEEFDFVKSKNRVPPLEPSWARQVAEIGPGVFSYRFDAVNQAERQEEHVFAVDRIVLGGEWGGTVLTCNAKVDQRDLQWVEPLEKLCAQLTYEVVAPRPDAAP